MNNSKKSIATYTLGCKVNAYDTEAIEELFSEKGYELKSFDEFADIYIINTCTVTNIGDKKSRQMIRSAKQSNPNAIVVACGCYAQVRPEELKKIKEVNIILGTKDRKKIVEIVENYEPENGIFENVSNVMEEKIFENLKIEKLANKTRAFLKIEDGCDRFCSYCIIPYARGPVRSRNPEDVLNEVNILAKNGFKEIVLAGIHVASYGKDLLNTNLTELLFKVNEIEGIERIRFSSIEPAIITKDFVNSLKDMPKICDHFHLSLQSGSDKTLKNMNRRYTSYEYELAVTILRENFPNVALTTDVIAGFPGETEEDFLESYNFIKKIKLSKLHVFPYSPKEGTKAASFNNQVSPEIKNLRTKKLINLGEELNFNFMNNFLNKEMSVLFEKSLKENYYEGHTTNYIKVILNSTENLTNQNKSVMLKKIENNCIVSEYMPVN